MKIWCSIIVLMLVLVGRCHAAEDGGTASGEFSDQITQTQKVFEEWDKDDSPGCAVGIVLDGELVYSDGFGIANLEYDEPITSKSVFRIGSTSKHFAAACIVLLEEEGKLSLDDDVRKYISELPEYNQTVTLRHMLHHTSGLPEYLALLHKNGTLVDPLDFFDEKKALQAMAEAPELIFPVGDKYQYTNSNYFLMSVVVERASGMTLAEYARENIFVPLGMKNTNFHDDVTEIVKNRATGYNRRENGHWRIDETTLEILGDGGIFTTIEDMVLWDQKFYENRLGKGGTNLTEKMQTKGMLNNGKPINYALGLEVRTYQGMSLISHGGAWVGFRSHYMRFPDQQFTIIVLCNLARINPGRLAEKVAEIWIGEPVAPITKLSQEILAQYEGTYSNVDFPKVIVSYFDGILGVRSKKFDPLGQSIVPLTPTEEHHFEFKGTGVLIDFNPQNNTMHYQQGNDDLIFAKLTYDEKDLKQYVGIYGLTDNPEETATVKVSGNRLLMSATWEGETTDYWFTAYEKDKFSGLQSDIVFKQSNEEQIIEWSEAGVDYVYKKRTAP